MAARILNVTPGEYHRDPCKTPSLSASIAHVLVDRSPLHAYTRHPRFGGEPEEQSDAMAEGTLIHRLILGKGGELAVLQHPDFRTKLAREQRDEAAAAGKIVVLEHKYDAAMTAAQRLTARCKELGFVFEGRSELAIEWDEVGYDGIAVVCRAMLDHVLLERGAIFDLKKAADCRPKKCERNFVENGYDIQYAAYTRALAALRPEFEGRVEFTFLFLELEPPYSVLPALPDGGLRSLGHMRWERAVWRWQECLEKGVWPSYCDRPVILQAPPWVLAAEEQGAYEG